MRKLISLFLAISLVLVFSVPAFAAETADSLANKLSSGWTQSSSPSGMGSSWYAIVRQFLNSLDSNVSTIKTNSNSILSKLDSIMNSYLHYIDADTSNISTNSNSIVTALGGSSYGTVTYQMSQMRTLLTEIKNKSVSWTSEQASTVTSNSTSIKDSLVTVSDNSTSLLANSDDLKDGWFTYPQLQRPVAKSGYTNSWYFGVLQTIYNFNADFSKNKKNANTVSGYTDLDFSHLTFSDGVYGMLYRMQQVLADDDDLQLKADTNENKASAKDNFLSYDSDTSVKPDDIGGLSNLGTELRSNFSTGTVEASALFDFWNASDTFSWFSQDCKNNMVNVSGSDVAVLSLDDEPVYYSPYGEHMAEYEKFMEEGIK